MNTKLIGDYGERYATRYLKRHGYKILARNYRTKFSELDIIATDGKYLCFVEVKTRSNIQYGLPCEAVDIRKRHKIINGATYYAVANKIDSPIRFDVAEVYISKGIFGRVRVNLIKNAFSAEGSGRYV